MRTLPTLLILLAACSAAGGEEQPKSAGPATPATPADSAATAAGKPANKPADGATASAPTSQDGFGSAPSQTAGPPAAEAPPITGDENLPEIRRLDPSEIEAQRQGGTHEIRRAGEGKP